MSIRLASLLLLVSCIAANVGYGQGSSAQQRRVSGNSIVSDKLPKIRVDVNKAFKFVGRFDFVIGDMARGERFVFVDAAGKSVKRLFIAQFEAILRTSQEIYRYSFEKATQFGEHRFRQNTFAYSNAEAKRENPKGEAALTAEFLLSRGYRLEDELMSSRFLTVPDPEKKHELILFYIENVSRTKKRIGDFYIGEEETPIWNQIASGLKQRSLSAFQIR